MILSLVYYYVLFFFFFNDTATTEIYTLSLHDALPICLLSYSTMRLSMKGDYGVRAMLHLAERAGQGPGQSEAIARRQGISGARSEEHTSEIQSRQNLVCRLLFEKKKKKSTNTTLYLHN